MSQLLHIYTKSVLNMALVQWGKEHYWCIVTLWCYYIHHWYSVAKQHMPVLNDHTFYKKYYLLSFL